MDVLGIIQELERELDIKQGIFSKKIDIDNCLDLLEHLKLSVGEKVGEADRVLESRVEILKNADYAAKNTIKEAEKRAKYTATNNELVKIAQREADMITSSAYRQGEDIIKKTKEHLDMMFRDIEEFLLSNLTMIRKNREELASIVFSINSSRN